MFRLRRAKSIPRSDTVPPHAHGRGSPSPSPLPFVSPGYSFLSDHNRLPPAARQEELQRTTTSQMGGAPDPTRTNREDGSDLMAHIYEGQVQPTFPCRVYSATGRL